MQRFLLILVVIVSCIGVSSARVEATPTRALVPEQQCFFGTIYTQFGLIVDALPLLESGVASLTTSGPASTQLGECALWLGVARQSIGDWNGALEAYTLARKQFEARGDAQLTWTMWYGTASLYLAQGRFSEAREVLESKVLPGVADTSSWQNPGLAAIARVASHNNYGVVLGRMRDYAAAQREVTLALTEVRKLIGETALSGTSDTGINPHDLLRLLRFSQQIASGTKNISDPQTMIELLALTGSVLPVSQIDDTTTSTESQADMQSALDQILNGSNPQDLQSALDHVLGGSSDMSGPGGLLAAQISQWLQDPTDANTATNAFPVNLGSVDLLREVTSAMAQAFEPIMLNNLGEIAREQNDTATAQTYFREATERIDAALAQQPTVPSTAFYEAVRALVLNNIGMAHVQENDDGAALTAFYHAADIMRRMNLRIMLASTLTNTSVIRQRRNEFAPALRDIAEAIGELEKTRVVAESNTLNLVASQGSSTSSAYALSGSLIQMIDAYNYAIQVSYHFAQQVPEPQHTELLQAAFTYAERSRARLFLENTMRGSISLNDPSVADLVTAERRTYILRQVAKDTLVQMQQVNPPSPLLQDFQDQKARTEQEYSVSSENLRQVAPHLMMLTGAQSGVLNLPTIQALLDPETTMVSFFSFDQRIFPNEPTLAFIITRKTMQVVPLPLATPVLLQGMIGKLQVWRKSASGKNAPRPPQELYTALIAPINDLIKTPIVAIVPHQSLHYIPFAGLSNGDDRYFGDQKTLFFLPSASTLALVQENARQTVPVNQANALVFGEPTIDSSLPLEELHFARTEAISISSLLQTSALTGKAASEATFKANVADQQIVHLAAHSIYSNTSILDSAVYLAPGDGEDGVLRAGEVYGLDIRRADLVVLSACETNVGSIPAGNTSTPTSPSSKGIPQAISSGDEVLSLGRAFLSSGASSVIATLWKVDDASTAVLMSQFYQHWQGEHLTKAEALHLAQNDVRKINANPYFWAGFVLNGDPGVGRARFQIQQSPTTVPTIVPTVLSTTPDIVATPLAATVATNPPASGGLCSTALILLGISVSVVSLKTRRKRQKQSNEG